MSEHAEATAAGKTMLDKVFDKCEQDKAKGRYAEFAAIEDPGLDEGIKGLTTDRIEKVVRSVIDNETGMRLKAYVNACVHCGLCSEACHHYLSNFKNPKFSPVGKIKRTMWKILDSKGRLTPEEIREMSIVASTECNVCRRCLQYCPFGIDIAYMIALVRRICNKCFVTPQYIQDTAHSHAVTMNQMWVKEDEWIDTLFWQEDDTRDEFPRARIPLDKEGAEVFYSVIGPEPKFRAQLIYEAAAIFHEAGIDWMMASEPGWDNSDMCMYTGETEMMARVKKYHYESAMRFKCKKIVMGECGHAFRSVYDMGNRALGWRMPPIPMVHALQYYYDLMKEGKLKVHHKYPEKVTFHDPCNTVRGRGLHEYARHVVRAFCDFVEMEPNREYNFCCNAGGGVINCGPPWKTKRTLSNRVKAEQFARVIDQGVTTLISPCHNCHSGLEDINEHYGLGLKIVFLCDIISECMVKSKAAE